MRVAVLEKIDRTKKSQDWLKVKQQAKQTELQNRVRK